MAQVPEINVFTYSFCIITLIQLLLPITLTNEYYLSCSLIKLVFPTVSCDKRSCKNGGKVRHISVKMVTDNGNPSLYLSSTLKGNCNLNHLVTRPKIKNKK